MNIDIESIKERMRDYLNDSNNKHYTLEINRQETTTLMRELTRKEENIKMWVDEFEEKGKQYVSIDPDYRGHIIIMLAEYHNYVIDLWERGEMESLDAMDTCYLLGNIEGRAISNCITIDDVEMLELWEEELDAYKLQ